MLPTLLSLAAVPVLVHAHYNNIPGQKSSSTVVYEIPGASSTAAVHTTYSEEEDCEEETSTSIAYTSTADVETTSIVVSETQPTSTEEDCEEESTTEGSYPETSTHGGYTETTTGDSSAETTTPGPNAESSTEVYETPGASTTEEDDCDETETATSSYGASTTDDSSAETTTHGPGAESSTEVYETPGASTTDDSSAETTTPGPDSESSTQVYETPATTTEEDDCDETETATSSYGVETTSTAVETTETGSESSAVSTEAESTTETAGQTTETGSGSTAVSSVYQGTTSAPETVTSTYTTTNVYTITSCAPTVTNCPVGSVTTEVVTSYTTFCPATETETETEATSVSTLETVDVPYPGTTGGDNSGESATSTAPYETLTSTYTTTNVYTITSCAPTVTNCPVGSVTTEVVTSYTTYCPATETEGEATSVSTVETVDVPYPITTGDNSGESATSTTPYETYTSTYTTTNVYTITSCAPTVTNCPVGSVTTEVVTSYTTWCPATETEGEATSSHEAEQTTSVPSVESLTSTITSTHVYTVTACPPSVTNCPVGSVTTEVLTSYTAYHPGTTAPAETTGTTTLTKTSTLTKTKTRVHTISDCYGNESCHEGDVTTEVYTATEVTEVTTKETAATYTVHKTVGCSEGSYGCVEGSSSTTYLVTVQPSTVYPQPTGVSVPSTYQAPHVNATTSVGFYTSTAKVTYPVPVTTGGESSGSEPSTTPVTVPTGSAAAWNAPGFVAMALGLLAAVAI